MFALVIQTLLLIAIAFILGAVVGCLLRGLFGSSSAEVAPAAATSPTRNVTNTPDAPVAVPVSAKSAPVIPNPPMPEAPLEPAEKAKVATPAASLVGASTKSSVKTAKPTPRKPADSKVSPKTPAASAKVAAPSGEPDNLKLIKGIGPQNEARLNALGVTQFAQIAAWKRKDEANYGEVLSFPGRIEREEWVKQAKVLQKGGTTDFSKRAKAGSVISSLGTAAVGDTGEAPSSTLKSARDGKADDLTLIDGVGGAIEKKMFKLGIFHFDQVAAMSKKELVWLGNMVGFPGRPERENWAGEAKVLAAGGRAGQAKKAKRGQIKSKRK